MTDQLRPCPACGKIDRLIRARESGLNVYMMCICRRFSTIWHPTLAACTTEWNTRPIEDHQAAIIEAQRAALKAAENGWEHLWMCFCKKAFGDTITEEDKARDKQNRDEYYIARASLAELERQP